MRRWERRHWSTAYVTVPPWSVGHADGKSCVGRIGHIRQGGDCRLSEISERDGSDLYDLRSSFTVKRGCGVKRAEILIAPLSGWLGSPLKPNN